MQTVDLLSALADFGIAIEKYIEEHGDSEESMIIPAIKSSIRTTFYLISELSNSEGDGNE